MQFDWCPYKKRRFGHTDTRDEDTQTQYKGHVR